MVIISSCSYFLNVCYLLIPVYMQRDRFEKGYILTKVVVETGNA